MRGDYTRVKASLGKERREWPLGATNAEVEKLVDEQSEHGDALIFTDGSDNRGIKSGWAFNTLQT